MKTYIIKTYRFNELSDKAKEEAVKSLQEINIHHDWYEFIFEDVTRIGGLMGFDINKIYFRGFWSKGDGACFEGRYEYAKQSIKRVKEYAPLDTELHAIAQALYDIQKKCFYTATATIHPPKGCYVHEDSTTITYNDHAIIGREPDGLPETIRDFMRWIYKRLEQEYNYLTSNEAIIETIRINEYEFTKGGSLY